LQTNCPDCMVICAMKTNNRSAHSNVEAKGGTAFNSKGKKYSKNCPYASCKLCQHIGKYTFSAEPEYPSQYSDSLQAGWSRDHIPVGGKVFCAHPDCPQCPPNLLYNGYQVFPGVKQPGHGMGGHPPHLAPRLKK